MPRGRPLHLSPCRQSGSGSPKSNPQSTAQALALRACIILPAAAGASNAAVAAELGVTTQTVGKRRRQSSTSEWRVCWVSSAPGRLGAFPTPTWSG